MYIFCLDIPWVTSTPKRSKRSTRNGSPPVTDESPSITDASPIDTLDKALRKAANSSKKNSADKHKLDSSISESSNKAKKQKDSEDEVSDNLAHSQGPIIRSEKDLITRTVTESKQKPSQSSVSQVNGTGKLYNYYCIMPNTGAYPNALYHFSLLRFGGFCMLELHI